MGSPIFGLPKLPLLPQTLSQRHTESSPFYWIRMTETGAALSAATMASMAALELDVMPWKVQVSNASTAASDGSDGFQESLREALSPGSSDSDNLPHIIPASTQSQKMLSAAAPMGAGMLSTTPSIAPPPGLEIEIGAEDVNIPSKAEPTSSPEGLFDLVSALQSELYTQQAQLMQPMQTLPTMQPSMVPEGVWTSMPMTLGAPFADGLSPLPSWHGYNHVSTQDPMHPMQSSARSRTLKNSPNALRVRQFCTACGVRIQQSSALFCTDCGHRLD
eukprot:s2443_g13.t1